MTLLEFKLNEENDNYYYFTIVIEIGGCVYKKKEIKIIDCFKAKSPGKEWSRRISDGDYLRHSLSFDFEYNIILLNDLTILANELKNSGTWGEAKRIASNIEGTAKQIRTL